jgi:hypothetical protein
MSALHLAAAVKRAPTLSQRERVSPKAMGEGLRRFKSWRLRFERDEATRGEGLQRRSPSPGCCAAALSLWERAPAMEPRA